jgi:hypothetical protein
LRAILRLVKVTVLQRGTKDVEPPKGFLLPVKVGSFKVSVYEAHLDYLLVQPESYSDVFPFRGPLRISQKPWTSYCQWHNGPLEEADDPTKRLYCPVPAEGFCSKHRRSDRAIYTLCLDSRSPEALEACKAVDKKVQGEYVVYMVDFGGDRPKVGTTRRFRLLERIAEQPHVTAAVLMVTDSLYKARRAEMTLSKEGVGVESWRHKWVLGLDLYFSATRLAEFAERASKVLGEQWSGEILTVTADVPHKPMLAEAELLVGKSFRVIGAWGGYLVLEGDRGPLALKYSQLMHRDSLLVEGEELGLK